MALLCSQSSASALQVLSTPPYNIAHKACVAGLSLLHFNLFTGSGIPSHLTFQENGWSNTCTHVALVLGIDSHALRYKIKAVYLMVLTLSLYDNYLYLNASSGIYIALFIVAVKILLCVRVDM